MVLVLAEDWEPNSGRPENQTLVALIYIPVKILTYHDVPIAHSVEWLNYNTYLHKVILSFRVQTAQPQNVLYFFLVPQFIVFHLFFNGLFRIYILKVCDFISFISSLYTIYFKMVTLLFNYVDRRSKSRNWQI